MALKDAWKGLVVLLLVLFLIGCADGVTISPPETHHVGQEQDVMTQTSPSETPPGEVVEADTPMGGFCGRSTGGACNSNSDCTTGGCSGQLCGSKFDDSIGTTCEWADCYANEAFGAECVCLDNVCQWEANLYTCENNQDCILVADFLTCANNKCVFDPCFKTWKSGHNAIMLVKFKENASIEMIKSAFEPLNEISPKRNYAVGFPIDIYSFKLPREKTDYPCGYDYIWCYVRATDSLIVYLNNNPNVNAFVSGYEEITVAVNSNIMNETGVVNLVNSFEDIISVEDLSVDEGFYGFYYVGIMGETFARYICDYLDNNENVESLQPVDIWLQEIYEQLEGCTSRTTFFPTLEPCSSE